MDLGFLVEGCPARVVANVLRAVVKVSTLLQEAFKRDPHGGDLYVFRGRSGKLIKILWHDGLGMSLYVKRLERGCFLWPSSADGVVTITPAQLSVVHAALSADQPSVQKTA